MSVYWATWTDFRYIFISIDSDGEDWKRMRSVLDKRMLRPNHVATYTEGFNQVVTDFVHRLRTIRDKKGGGLKVPSLDVELFHWSIESMFEWNFLFTIFI